MAQRAGRVNRIPRQTRIHGETWTIKRPGVLKDHNGRDCYGLCDYDNCVIYIVAHIGNSERAWVTYRHEKMHAAIYATGFYRVLEVQIKNDGVRGFVEDDLIDRVIPAYLESERHDA